MKSRLAPPPPTNPAPGWDLYRSFLAVLEEGSLCAAARALGIAQPTVGRHVEALEQALARTLFTRSPQGLRPTELAQALAPHARALRAAAAALQRTATAQGDEVRGTVRVSASEVVGVNVLPALLAGLNRRHPLLQIELVASDEVSDLLQRDADVAVRMVRPTQAALLAVHVGNLELGLHARDSYLEDRGHPSSWEELAGHALIGFDRETELTRRLRGAYPALHRRAFSLRTDSQVAGLEALRAGFGIGVCQVRLAERDPRLVRVLPEAFSVHLPVWIAMHEDLRASARCRAVFDTLADGLREYVSGARTAATM